MKKIKIAPSIMCCKIDEIKDYIQLFEKVKINSIHFDVMDGHYVPNMMLGTTDYKDIKRMTSLPVDIHLMCINPESFIEIYDVQPGDYVSFHPETAKHPYKLLQTIHGRGCKAGLVINPGTPLSFLEESIDIIDYVTLMTVNPGFSGQEMVPNAVSKIRRTRALLDSHGYENISIVVDGNTVLDNAKKMKKAGADTFVVGTSSLLKELETFEDNYRIYTKELEVA